MGGNSERCVTNESPEMRSSEKLKTKQNNKPKIHNTHTLQTNSMVWQAWYGMVHGRPDEPERGCICRFCGGLIRLVQEVFYSTVAWGMLGSLVSHIVDCGENESESEQSKGWNEFPTKLFC